VDQIPEKLIEYTKKYPHEKIYIHFDKPYYSTGDDIWFKAYLVDATYFLPSGISNVIHVELIDPSGRIMDQKMLKSENGGAPGEFKLPDAIEPGKYTIRAYTNWMRNFDPLFFYRKSFQVLKTQISEGTEERVIYEPMDLQFFPEGGELISGINSIVAFKATDASGASLDVRGIVVDNADNEIATIETSNLGMGRLLMTPEPDQTYRAKVTIEGKDFVFDLPEVKPSGFAIKVLNNHKSSKITVGVNASDASLEGGMLLAHQNGRVFFTAVANTQNSSFGVRIDRSDFPEGICHLTFFDASVVPRSERLVYANLPSVYSEILLDGISTTYSKRSKISLSLTLKDTSEVPLRGNFSMAITPQEIIKYPEFEENIISYLMLQSDLQGYIEQPSFYLNDTKESFLALDILMLTQGWRRFKWDDVLGSEIPIEHFVENGITISGRMVDYYNQEKPRQGIISMSILNDQFNLFTGETLEDGTFFFTGNDFTDSTDIVLQGKREVGKKGKTKDDVNILIDSWEKPQLFSDILTRYPIYFYPTTEDYLAQQEKIEQINQAFNFDPEAIMLDAVEIIGRNEKKEAILRPSGQIYNTPDSRIVADSLNTAGFITVFDLIRRLPGVQVRGSFPEFEVIVRGAFSIQGGSQPLFLLDGVPVDLETYVSLNPQDVMYADVLSGARAAIYGAQGGNGVIALYTKPGSYQAYQRKKGTVNFTHPGYALIREFYIPNYDTAMDIHAKPDIRSTFYWNPEVLIDSTGVASIEFYSSDQEGTFDIRIEGITQYGEPVVKQATLEVD
jgi:hypothetical protein